MAGAGTKTVLGSLSSRDVPPKGWRRVLLGEQLLLSDEFDRCSAVRAIKLARVPSFVLSSKPFRGLGTSEHRCRVKLTRCATGRARSFPPNSRPSAPVCPCPPPAVQEVIVRMSRASHASRLRFAAARGDKIATVVSIGCFARMLGFVLIGGI